jgi:hypothetical protein
MKASGPKSRTSRRLEVLVRERDEVCSIKIGGREKVTSAFKEDEQQKRRAKEVIKRSKWCG